MGYGGNCFLGDPDSEELWTEIIDQIPDEVFLNPDIKILNVACGYGTESKVIVRRMRKLGFDNDYINNRIYVLDKAIWATNRMMLHGRFKNVIRADFLTWETDMKFDIVVGNPPFKQLAKNGRQTNKSLWKEFLTLSVDITAENGYTCLITPTGWCSPSDNGKIIERVFSEYNLIYADISDRIKNYFNVSSTFGYTIVQKNQYQGKSEINCNDGVHVVDLRKTKLITNKGLTIIKKLTESSEPRCNFFLAGINHQYKGTGYHTDNKTANAIHANIHHVNSSKDYLNDSGIPVRWSEIESPLKSKKKVVIPYNGPTKVIIDDGHYGVGWCQTMLLKEEESVEHAKTVFNSNLYKFFSRVYRHTQYNETKNLNVFPKLDLTRSWSNQQLYNHFNLTKEEIELIESSC